MVDHGEDTAAEPDEGQASAPGWSPLGPAQEGALGEGERVAKALARAGVASRREVERYIAAGRVALNGQVLDTPAVKVAPGDILTVDGEVVGTREPTRLFRYHKPAGLITTNSDPQRRPTVFENLPDWLPRVLAVGRLDLNTEGLLLLTNDGALSRALELPASGWVRRYRARAHGSVTQGKLDTLKDGIVVDGVSYGPIEARIDKAAGHDRTTGTANLWISVAITEGKNREVRKVLEHLGLKVNRLIRLAYGPFALSTLPVGEVEEVGPRVIREQLAGHVAPENLPTGDHVLSPPPPPRPAQPEAPRRPARPAGPRPLGAQRGRPPPEVERRLAEPWRGERKRPEAFGAHSGKPAATPKAREGDKRDGPRAPREGFSGKPASGFAKGKPAPGGKFGGGPGKAGGKTGRPGKPAQPDRAPQPGLELTPARKGRRKPGPRRPPRGG